MKIRTIFYTIAMVSTGTGTMALPNASMAAVDYSNCTPLVHTNLKIKPTYNYKPNGKSFVRIHMESKLVNASRDRVYYLGEDGTRPSYTSLRISAQGKTHIVKNNEKITKHLRPGGGYGLRQLGDRPVDVAIPHLNADMKVTLRADVINSGCVGRRTLTHMIKTYDLRPMLSGNKAKQVGRTQLNYAVEPRLGQGAPAPRPRN